MRVRSSPDDERLIAPNDLDLGGFAELELRPTDVADLLPGEPAPLEFDNDIATLQPTMLSWAMAHEAEDQYPSPAGFPLPRAL